MSRLNVGNLFNENEDGAPVVSGISTFSSPNYFVPPSGSTAQRPQNPGEGMIRFNTDSGHLEYYTGTHWADVITNNNELGDQNNSNSSGGTGTRMVFGSMIHPTPDATMEYITIDTLGNAQTFGEATVARAQQPATMASSTRGLFAGGYNGGTKNEIDFITFASTGDAIDFGDTSTTTRNASTGTCSNQTRGIMFVGGGPSQTNAINYVTMSSSSNGIDFGDLNAAVGQTGALASSVRGINFGGSPNNSNDTNRIDYITISTTGNAQDFGDLTQPGRYQSGLSNSTRGVIHEADYPSAITTLTFVTTASTGNAQDFGDAITAGAQFHATGSSPTRGIFGSMGPGNLGKIEYVTIPTTGNGISFGDLVNSGGKGGGVTNGHGGL